MGRAPIGAVIRHWLRPQRDGLHIHRIEVEHALYLAAATQEQIKDTLTLMLRQQTKSLGHILQSLNDLGDEIAAGLSAGFSAVNEGLAIVDDTLRRGFYQLHLDELGTHARLDDLLLLIYDKEGYQRKLAAQYSAARDRDALYKASNEYSAAMTRTRQALNESNLAKAGAMLDEAVVLFRRASNHPSFALEAHFQLGYLAQQHERNIEAAYEYYNKALGPDYSPHFVRTTRHLAHLDYLTRQEARALDRMQKLIAHDHAISAFAHDLQMANNQPWEEKACILALKAALENHMPLLEQCARLSDVRSQFDDGRCFSATESFRQSHSLIQKELDALRPEIRVYFDAARYAVGSGHSAQAVLWIKHCYDAQPTLQARHAFLIEAMADDGLRQGEVEAFLQKALAVTEQQKSREEAVARRHVRAQEEAAREEALEAQRLRRNAASREMALSGAVFGALFGGIVMGLSGCVSCLHNFQAQHTLMTDFNLFNGLLYGAIGGAVIGVVGGILIGQTKD